MNNQIKIYDTTLRDGSQGEGINFSVNDKIRIAEKLNAFGIILLRRMAWLTSRDFEFFK
jgi:2-isopropylmalate synthase